MRNSMLSPSRAKAAVRPPLDPGFESAELYARTFGARVESSGGGRPVVIAVEREEECVSRVAFHVAGEDGPLREETLRFMERVVKFMLWSCGGWRIYVGGADWIGAHIREQYRIGGPRKFDAELMGKVYEREVEVVVCEADAVPEAREAAMAAGGHLEGCRIGFDLGASDYKISSVRDGEPVFTTEIPWHPVVEADPAYHLAAIEEGLRRAAEHLPRVDAIGGSSAGIYVNDRPMVASLFRAVPEDRFNSEVRTMFERLRDKWNVPLTVINDGDVTALAGAMSLERNGMLGIAMGSSEAVGFLDRNGNITGRLNELAFAPVDFSPAAAVDEWSGDRGVGALYFSQQAVNKLAPAAGFTFPEDMLLPERLKVVQAKAEEGDAMALKIFESIGIYLGYTLPWYARF